MLVVRVIVVVGGRWAIFADGINVVTRCQSVVLGDGRWGQCEWSESYKPCFAIVWPSPFYVHWEGRQRCCRQGCQLGCVATRHGNLDPKNGGKQKQKTRIEREKKNPTQDREVTLLVPSQFMVPLFLSL
jgi:hypothetical protein